MAIRSVVTRAAFLESVAEAGAAHLDLAIGSELYPGFLGTVAQLGLFVLAARARFGPYDAAQVALAARARNTGGRDSLHPDEDARVESFVDGERGNLRLHFYFPGLELL